MLIVSEAGAMGLMDVLNGMRNGPRGQVAPSPGGGSGGMSPLTMGLLAFLAYKAFKGGGLLSSGGPSPPPTSGQNPAIDRPNGSNWLGGLGSLIAGGGAGSILSGGLGELVKRFQQNGQGHIAQSWVGTGSN